MEKNYKRITVKIGSNVLTSSSGTLDHSIIENIVDQVEQLRKNSVEVILVTSGAVAAGKSEFVVNKKLDSVSARQLWSAIGQVKLMNTYAQLFSKRGMTCAQVLTMKENFSDRRHYLNQKNCITTMLENGVIPIVNENDTISVTELMFTDNDELSGLISSMMSCDALYILTNVDGVYNGNPNNPDTQLLPVIYANSADLKSYISTEKSGMGRGGMLTKCNIAIKMAKQGIAVHVANGKKKNIICEIQQGSDVNHTHFIPSEKRSNGVKKWLAHSDSFAKGYITVNEGAKVALLANEAKSLLLIGVSDVFGNFEKGDIIGIRDTDGNSIGIGTSKYDSDEAKKLKGTKVSKPIIHYDYLSIIE